MIQKVARAIFFAQNWREMPKDGDPEAEAAWTDGDSALQAGGDPCFLLRAEAIHLARAATLCNLGANWIMEKRP